MFVRAVARKFPAHRAFADQVITEGNAARESMMPVPFRLDPARG